MAVRYASIAGWYFLRRSPDGGFCVRIRPRRKAARGGHTASLQAIACWYAAAASFHFAYLADSSPALKACSASVAGGFTPTRAAAPSATTVCAAAGALTLPASNPARSASRFLTIGI